MISLLKLILAHFIGDFVLQPQSWISSKQKNKAASVHLYLHALLQGALSLVFLGDYAHNWPLAIAIAAIHLLIDLLKLYQENNHNSSAWYLFDQFLHLMSIFLLWRAWFYPDLDLRMIYTYREFWLYLTAIVALVWVSGISIQKLMNHWSKEIDDSENQSLVNAGKWIGILERLLIFAFIMVGHWEAVGFLITAKSVFRYGSIQNSTDRRLTEYILIGSLLSFGMAISISLLVILLSGN